MKVGFAVQNSQGMESQVYDHFGSAPVFIIIDTEVNDLQTINNRDLLHIHGACNPMKALEGNKVDAMVVGGIGAGALTKLNALGVKVYAASGLTIEENLIMLSENRLQELSLDNSCSNAHGGCGH